MAWELIQCMTREQGITAWQPMTLDEYAEHERNNGATLEKVEGVWWKAIRPFFYRPLFPYAKLDPGTVKPPAKSVFGGYQHAVTRLDGANSYLNLFQFQDIHAYSIESAGKTLRKHIRKAAGSLCVREISDLDHFIADAYPVYLEFYARTGYRWRKDRTQQESFAEYSRRLFSFPKVLVWGVYAGERLVGVNLSYVVQDVVFDASMFATSEALKMGASDLLWHVLRERASTIPGINYIFEGMPTGHAGVDRSKILRGCHVSALPAYYRLNPLVHCVVKRLGKQALFKIKGKNDDEIQSAYCEQMNDDPNPANLNPLACNEGTS